MKIVTVSILNGGQFVFSICIILSIVVWSLLSQYEDQDYDVLKFNCPQPISLKGNLQRLEAVIDGFIPILRFEQMYFEYTNI